MLKRFEAKARIAVTGTTVEDAEVYWQTYLHLLENNAEAEESQPDLTLQCFDMGTNDWNGDTIGFSTMILETPNDPDSKKLKAHKLTDSSQLNISMRFRYVDQEGNAGEEIELKVSTWEADITRQYVEYYLNHRAADQQGKTFYIEMNIQAKTAEGDKIRMTYDEEYLSGLSEYSLSLFYQELKELPQWTGAGPDIPLIEGKDMLTKLNLDSAAISIVISGSSVTDIIDNKNASLTCHVEIPVTVEIPDTLPNGKLLWFYKEMPWKNIADTDKKVAFTVEYDSLSAILNEDCPRREKVKFCYESAGGSHVNDLTLASDILDNSAIVIEPYSQAFLEACLEELKTLSDSGQPVLRQYEITAFDTAEADDSIYFPQVRPEASAGGNTITGTEISELPESW